MKKSNKLLIILLALILSAMMVLPSCGVMPGSGGGIQENVTVGKRVFVDKSGSVFFVRKNLVCTALFKDGELSEFVPVGVTASTVYAMAVYNDYLYLSEDDGFFRYPLSSFPGEGKAQPETLTTPRLEAYGHFEIFEDRIFFMRGDSLCWMPAEGGEISEVIKDVFDFEVTDRGIYVAGTDGTMIVISPDLSDSRKAGRIAEGVRFNPGGMNFYYRDSNGGAMAYSVKKEESERVGNARSAGKYCTPWSNGENVLYCDDDYFCYFVTKDGEQDLGKNYKYPTKITGYIFGDYLLGNDGDSGKLWVFNLTTGEMKDCDYSAEMDEYLNSLGG